MPLARPAAVFASASFAHASYVRAARRIAAAAIERAGGRAQHQRLHLRRMGDGVFEHRPAAHRLADQAHVGEFQMIDQGGEVGGVVGGIGAAVDRSWTARSRDGRSSRRCSAARSARPAATSSGDCRPDRGRTAAPVRCPTPHSRDRRTAASIGRRCAPAPCRSWSQKSSQKRTSVEPTTPNGQRPAANRRNLLSKGEAASSASRASAS